MQYTFGTSQAAAARLEAIPEYFNPLAAELLGRYCPAAPALAVDVACGPGFTTQMLARATGASVTYGLDSSREFLDLARAQFPHCRFVEHDVTRVPFPVRADVLYARFILSHLAEPVEVVRRWV